MARNPGCHAWHAHEPDGLDDRQRGNPEAASELWSRHPGCPVGCHDLYAHAGRCHPHRTLFDETLRSKTSLCLDADGVSAWIGAVWICLEPPLAYLLPVCPGHRRRHSLADGDDFTVPDLFSRRTWDGDERDGRSPDGRARARTGVGRLSGDVFRLAMGLLH